MGNRIHNHPEMEKEKGLDAHQYRERTKCQDVCKNCQGSGMYAEASYIGTDVVTCPACNGAGKK